MKFEQLVEHINNDINALAILHFSDNGVTEQSDALHIELTGEFKKASGMKLYSHIARLQEVIKQAVRDNESVLNAYQECEFGYLTQCSDMNVPEMNMDDEEEHRAKAYTQMTRANNPKFDKFLEGKDKVADELGISDFMCTDFKMHFKPNTAGRYAGFIDVNFLYNECGNTTGDWSEEDYKLLSYVHLNMTEDEVTALRVAGLLSALHCLRMSMDGTMLMYGNDNEVFTSEIQDNPCYKFNRENGNA